MIGTNRAIVGRVIIGTNTNRAIVRSSVSSTKPKPIGVMPIGVMPIGVMPIGVMPIGVMPRCKCR